MPRIVKCKQCGCEIQKGIKVCPNCGKKIKKRKGCGCATVIVVLFTLLVFGSEGEGSDSNVATATNDTASVIENVVSDLTSTGDNSSLESEMLEQVSTDTVSSNSSFENSSLSVSSKKSSGNVSSTSETNKTKSLNIKQADLDDCAVSINGKVYQLPMKYQDFLDCGWTPPKGSMYYLKSRCEMMSHTDYTDVVTSKEGSIVTVSLYNFSKKAQPYSEWYICGMEIYKSLPGHKSFNDVTFPKDIQIGKSTKNDVILKYGKPVSEYQSKKNVCNLVYGDDSKKYKFTFLENDNKKYVLRNVFLCDANKPGSYVEPPDDVVEKPQYLKDYKLPESLSDEISSGQIEIDGVVYQLPIPLKELFDNGFDIGFLDDNLDTDTDTDIDPGTYYVKKTRKNYIVDDLYTETAQKVFRQYLIKDGKTAAIIEVQNIANYKVPLSYGLVYSIELSPASEDTISVRLPGNVTLTDKFEDFKNKIKNMKYQQYGGNSGDLSDFFFFNGDYLEMDLHRVHEGVEQYLNNSTQISYMDSGDKFEAYSVKLYYRLDDNTEALPNTIITESTPSY